MRAYMTWLPFVFLVLTPLSTSLLPHVFWGKKHGPQRTPAYRQKCGLSMYFDDCERRDDLQLGTWVGINSRMPGHASSPHWRNQFCEEKRDALEKYLGYTQNSAFVLSSDEIEEATLMWLVDCDIIDVDNDETNENGRECKYKSISDLVVASRSSTVSDCLALVWERIASMYESGFVSSDHDIIQMIAFPKALWEYETMVSMLDAIEICKPLLPSNFQLKIDLFHPDYKHAPKMWSPQSHSPFPTIGIQILWADGARENMHGDRARDNLRTLFNSVDAVAPGGSITGFKAPEDKTSADSVKLVCQKWVETLELVPIDGSTRWNTVMHRDPYQMYRGLWKEIQVLSRSSFLSVSLIVAPYLDAHTIHKLAVTVNAALCRFDSRIRISHVSHPDSKKHLYSPHPMVQIRKEECDST